MMIWIKDAMAGLSLLLFAGASFLLATVVQAMVQHA